GKVRGVEVAAECLRSDFGNCLLERLAPCLLLAQKGLNSVGDLLPSAIGCRGREMNPGLPRRGGLSSPQSPQCPVRKHLKTANAVDTDLSEVDLRVHGKA